MILARRQGLPLFMVRPDVLPYDHQTEVELMLWAYMSRDEMRGADNARK